MLPLTTLARWYVFGSPAVTAASKRETLNMSAKTVMHVPRHKVEEGLGGLMARAARRAATLLAFRYSHGNDQTICFPPAKRRSSAFGHVPCSIPDGGVSRVQPGGRPMQRVGLGRFRGASRCANANHR